MDSVGCDPRYGTSSAHRPPRQQRPLVAIDHALPGELLLEPPPARQPHPPAQLGIVEQPGDLPGQVGRVAGLEEQPGDARR